MQSRNILLALLLVIGLGACKGKIENIKTVNYDELAKKGLVIYEENFADANFCKFLLAQGFGADKVITPEEMAAITSINISGQNIRSLEGIENFANLVNLRISRNAMEELTLPALPALELLECNGCGLKKINFQACQQLAEIDCSDNQLDSITVSDMPHLTTLSVKGNLLQQVRIKKCPKLRSLDLSNNKLKAANLSQCTALHDINVSENKFHIENSDIESFVRNLPQASRINNPEQDNAPATIVGLELDRLTAAQQSLIRQKGWRF